MVDRLEWRDADTSIYEWDASAWYGGDFHKLWIETEGEHAGDSDDGRVEVLWDRIASAWWSTRLGLRQDFGEGPTRRVGWLSASRVSLPGSSSWMRRPILAAATARRCECPPTTTCCSRSASCCSRKPRSISTARRSGAAHRHGFIGSRSGLAIALRNPARDCAISGRELVEAFRRQCRPGESRRQETDEVTFVAGFRLWF